MKLVQASLVIILLMIVTVACKGRFECHYGFCGKECGRYWNAWCYVRGVSDDEKYVIISAMVRGNVKGSVPDHRIRT